MSYSAAGPGLAGALVQLLSAPLAVLAAVSFLIPAALPRSIRRSEPPRALGRGDSMRRSITDGLPKLLGHPPLRAILVVSVPQHVLHRRLLALYAIRDLGLAPATIGLVSPPGSGRHLGRDAGPPGRRSLRRRPGDHRRLGPRSGGRPAGPLGRGAHRGGRVHPRAVQAFEGITDTVEDIHQWSLRQAVTPDDLAGRVTAGHCLAAYGAGAAGALAGGALGTAVGLRPALFICAIGALLAAVSPLRQLREQSTPDSLTS